SRSRVEAERGGAVGVNRSEEDLLALEPRLLHDLLTDAVGEGGAKADQIGGDDDRPVALRILQRERLGVEVVVDLLEGFSPRSVASHLHRLLRGDLYRGDPRLPLFVRGDASHKENQRDETGEKVNHGGSFSTAR